MVIAGATNRKNDRTKAILDLAFIRYPSLVSSVANAGNVARSGGCAVERREVERDSDLASGINALSSPFTEPRRTKGAGRSPMEQTEIRFQERAKGIVSILEVDRPARSSVLELIRRTLFDLRIQIVRVESIVKPERLLERFHVVEFDGAPIARRRAAGLRSAVRRALRAEAA